MASNIVDIARIAGVSSTTVSHLINATETIPISAEKRKRIMEAMRQTNYRPSAASSSLRRKSELPDKAVFIFGNYPACAPLAVCRNPMLEDLLSELAAKLFSGLRLSLEIRSVADEDSKDSWNEVIADASAVVCYGKLDATLFDLTERRNTPLAVISETKDLQTRKLAAPPTVDRVFWNAAGHLEKIFELLVAKGAKRFAFVSSPCVSENNFPAAEADAKTAEFKELLRKGAGLSGELFIQPRFNSSFAPGYEAKNSFELLREKDLGSFDAIIGHNDFVAQGAVWALQSHGLIPGVDVMVCGEGDYPACRHCVPGVTTISYDKSKAAKDAVSILRRRLEENRATGEIASCSSVVFERESTGGRGA